MLLLLLLPLLLLWLLRCVASFIYDLTSCLCQKEEAQSATRRELGAMQSLAQLHKVEIKFSTGGRGAEASGGCAACPAAVAIYGAIAAKRHQIKMLLQGLENSSTRTTHSLLQ